MENKLEGVTVAVLVADGFEQVEVTGPMRALARAGATVRVISLRPGRIRGMNFMWRGKKLAVDDTVGRVDASQFGALLLPGGFVNPDLLRQSDQALELVRTMERLGRPIAVICHGPEVLISAGIVRGRRLTSWPAIADDVRNAGGLWEDAPVVRDGTWVSSRGPKDLFAFEEAMVETFAMHAARGLEVPSRALRPLAWLSRAATLGAGALLVTRVAMPILRGRRHHTRVTDARSIAHDVALAASFGGMLFAKTALDRAARVMPHPEDRGRMVVAPWRAFITPSGIALATALGTWLLGERRRSMIHSPRLTYLKDGLLFASIVTGAVNAFSGLKLAHADRVPMESGARPSPAAGDLAKVHNVGLVSGYGHLAAVGASIAVGAMLGDR